MALQTESEGGPSRLGDVLPDTVVRLLQAIRGSLMNFIAALGIAMIFLGLFGPEIPVFDGIVAGAPAGLLGIMGVSAILYAGIGYLIMHLIGYK